MKRALLTLFLLVISHSLFSQFESRGKEFDYDDAEKFFTTENYYDALPLYEKLHRDFPKVLEYRLKVGVCYLNLTTNSELAIKYIEEVYEKKPKTKDVLFYLAKAYALDYRFDEAIETFHKALKSSKTTDFQQEKIFHLIEQCNNAKELIKDSINVSIINLGNTINTIDNEYSPTVNADESTLIYTYRGEKCIGGRRDEFNREFEAGNYYDDIFSSTKVEQVWTTPKAISDSVNTEFHEASISLSPDGKTLFIYKDTKENSGDIFVSNKEGGEWTKPKPLSINTENWEGHAAISPKGDFLIFSSDRGPMGDLDLYKAKLQEDGSWGEIKNLGESINTPFNEDAPFIHSDGVTFNFSSEGHNSIGGYDIFESKIVDDSTFLTPRNIGYPINSTAHDVFFFVSGKGNAYYSSARKGGFGQQDIYVINVNEVVNSKPVMLVKGVVKTNGDFDEATITVKTESGKKLGTYHSDLADGKYQFYVDLNDFYVINFEVEGFSSKVESIDATKYTEYIEIERDVNFLSRNVNINGVALLRKNPLSPIMHMRVSLSNKDKTINLSDTTDNEGNYNFKNLPFDKSYLIALDEDDEKNIIDSTYLFKGKITMAGLPFSNAIINEIHVDDLGEFEISTKNKRLFGKLSSDLSNLSELDWDDPDLFEKFLKKYGDKTKEGLKFKVQVGAYNNPENYLKEHLSGLGEMDAIVLDDGITRFTIGDCTTLNEAYTLKNNAVDKGQSDAFIIMFDNGKRTYLEELVESGVFK